MIACLKGNQSMIKLLIDFGADPSQRILLKDFLLLRRLKTSKKSIRLASRFSNIADLRSIPSPSATHKSIDCKRENDKFQQFGHRSPIHLSEEYIEEKYICLFEMAAIRGDYETASFLLRLYDYL